MWKVIDLNLIYASQMIWELSAKKIQTNISVFVGAFQLIVQTELEKISLTSDNSLEFADGEDLSSCQKEHKKSRNSRIIRLWRIRLS